MVMDNKYKTFADEFYLEEAGFIRRLKRDLRLLHYMSITVVLWIKAGKVRNEFQRCREACKEFYVDRFAPSGTKK